VCVCVCVFSTHAAVSPFALQGGRELDDFVAYLKKEATSPLVIRSSKKQDDDNDDDKTEL